MKRPHATILALAVCWITHGADAHHAMEYIELESYNTSPRGESLIYLQYDYMVPDDQQPDLDRWEITPGWAYGITDKLLVDFHTHFAKFGNGHIEETEQERFAPDGPSPFFEAVTASLLYRFTETGPYHAAGSAAIEIPLQRAKDLLGDEDPVYTATLIFGRDFGTHANVIVNLGLETDGSDHEGFWGVGAKAPLSVDPHGVAGGIELHGDFDGDEWRIIPGVFLPVGHDMQLKVGFSFGQEKDDGRWANTRQFTTAIMARF